MAEAELVVDSQLVEGSEVITPPRVNNVSLTRLDDAVDRIVASAEAFECASAEDYEESAKQIQNIRKLTTMYEQIFAPMKAWWTARLSEARGDETSRTNRLADAKKLRERKMLSWKSAEDKRTAELQRQQREIETKRAEERRLAEAEVVAQTRGQEAAMRALERPLNIAPTQVASVVPKLAGTGVKTVKRKVLVAKMAYARLSKLAADQNRLMTDDEWEQAQDIAGSDFEELVICVAASLLLQREPLDVAVKDFLKPLATKCQNPQRALKGVDTKWVKGEAAYAGETFSLGGVQVVIREGLG